MVELIGFPTYFVENGNVYHNGVALSKKTGVVKLYYGGKGQFFRIAINKVIYAAENKINPRKLKSARILVRDGVLTSRDAILRKYRDEKKLKIKPKNKAQKIEEIRQYIEDAQVLLNAFETDNWEPFNEMLERYRGFVYSYVYKRYSIKSAEHKEEIFCEARFRILQRLQDSNIIVNLKMGLLKYVNAIVAEYRRERKFRLNERIH